MITARYHREIPQRYRLEASQCTKCKHISFPPRLVCPACGGNAFASVALKDEGTLQTFTVVRVASDKFSKETPFAVGIVKLDDGVQLTTQIADASVEDLKIGQRVKLVFRKIQDDGKAGIHCYGYKAITL